VGTDDIQFNITIHSNTFIDAHADTTCISIVEQPSIDIHDNIFIHTGGASTTARISITGTLLTTASCNVSNNVILSDTYCGTIVVGGELAARANKINNITIIGNYLNMTNHTNSIHGIGLFRQNSPTIKYNKVVGTGLGIVVKCLETESSGGNVGYNTLVECLAPMFGKGSNGVTFNNNTIYNTEKIYGAFAFQICEYTGSTAALNNVFKNNVVYSIALNDSNPAHNNILNTDQSPAQMITNGNVLSNNCVYNLHGPYSSSYATLALAQAAGIEVDSISTNPNLTTGLWPTIPIEVGEDLGATYDDGLDTTTNFGNATTIPVVVTKQQVEPWQVGAFVQ
jgi:hypothetical protein